MFSQDQEAWGGGTAGSSREKDMILVYYGKDDHDGTLSRRASHNCQGIFHCNQLDMTLIENCQRYDPEDLDDRNKIVKAERAVNAISSRDSKAFRYFVHSICSFNAS